MKLPAPLACWQLPGDPLALHGVRIGDRLTFDGHPGVWFYAGCMIATSVAADVPRVHYLADRHIPALRQRLHRK